MHVSPPKLNFLPRSGTRIILLYEMKAVKLGIKVTNKLPAYEVMMISFPPSLLITRTLFSSSDGCGYLEHCKNYSVTITLFGVNIVAVTMTMPQCSLQIE